MTHASRTLIVLGSLCLGLATWAAPSPASLDEIQAYERSYDYPSCQIEQQLVEALEKPLCSGKDVSVALDLWLQGIHLRTANPAAAQNLWQQALDELRKPIAPLPPLPERPIPDSTLTLHQSFRIPGYNDVLGVKVSWETDVKNYGVLIVPVSAKESHPHPLIVWTHGAAFGVPAYFLPTLAEWSRYGYVILAPALRGEPLFCSAYDMPGLEALNENCGGKIENLDGEVDDLLGGAKAARKLQFIRPGRYAVMGHSFGAGATLLATARDPDIASCVSYDAWFVNPFRHYWDRMRQGPNNWLSWNEYAASDSAKEQLLGLQRRSFVNQADKVRCPLFMFIGQGYDGSLFHQCHQELTEKLTAMKKPYYYLPIPDGGHNFVLDTGMAPAKTAFRIQWKFMMQHYPPAGRPPAAKTSR